MTDQIKNLITQLLTGIGAYFVGRGWISNDLLMQIVPGVVTLVGIGYSIYLNLNSSKIASVAAMPEVKTVVTDSKTAASIPATNVVAG